MSAEPLIDAETLRQLERLRLTRLDALIGQSGERVARERAAGVEFDDYRPYTRGDDLRAIDWNLYARLGEPFVKLSPGEGRITLALLVDVSRSMGARKLHHARRLAAAIGAIGLLAGDAVTLWAICDGDATPGPLLAGRRALAALVQCLEELPSGTTTGLRTGVAAFARTGADVAILISDLLVDPDQDAAIEDLAAASRVAAVAHVLDPDEASPRLDGELELEDAESGARLSLTVNRTVRERYARLFDARVQDVRRRCDRNRVLYLPARVDVAPLDLLAETFAGELMRG